ncbi:Biopolymer transport protein ExbB [Marinomonas spartinae]|uniref:Biopolymer transport protein ExbB n=2 Tax=Marinomonas spartinae TaxID=1792290 RepID=A0A1A8TSM8_9GAMM|nr:Biopolymer transport protein ExbB [Marinomonas spartinae]SBS39011.1 Biopolymer transport protein ExbB [Marinomonas spartinae]
MNIDMNFIHDATFYIMYFASIVGVFVIVERSIYFSFTLRQSRKLEKVLKQRIRQFDDIPETVRSKNCLPLALLKEFFEGVGEVSSHNELEDLSQAIYISMRGLLVKRLWILEAIVAGAPLLGLLGTIFGIIDTFKALAESGVSDPSLVSKSIGSALYATALGIGIAVVGLTFNHRLQDRLELINDHLKILLLRAGLDIKEQK